LWFVHSVWAIKKPRRSTVRWRRPTTLRLFYPRRVSRHRPTRSLQIKSTRHHRRPRPTTIRQVARAAAVADATARKQPAKNLVIERMTEQPLDFFVFVS